MDPTAEPAIGAEAGTAASESVAGMQFEPRERVRLGVIGAGNRPRGLLRNFLAVDNVEVTAICDPDRERAAEVQAEIERRGRGAPALYTAGNDDYENMVRRDDVDLVCVGTPWDWHVPMAVSAMEAGKHVCVEVPAATTLEGCWRLVDTSERTRRHCVMLENCCYGRNELLVLNMVRAGVLGDILHGEGAYIHDLRAMLFDDRSEGAWRRFPHIDRNGNLYPTHGLGPIACYMEINRGDRFDYMVSMSSPSRGLDAWREEHVDRASPKWRETYRCGDVNTSLIKTAAGRTIVLQHNVVSPRPYDRFNVITGSRGIFRDYPPRVYVDDQEGPEEYTALDPYRDRFEHRLWRQEGERARQVGGHGGIDFIMLQRLVHCMREGLAPDMDVYDAAAWSAPGPLSDASVTAGSAPVEFPDFTRGHWQERREHLV